MLIGSKARLLWYKISTAPHGNRSIAQIKDFFTSASSGLCSQHGICLDAGEMGRPWAVYENFTECSELND